MKDADMDDIENSWIMGERVGDMTREQLLEALSVLASELRYLQERHRSELNVWSKISAARLS